MHYPEKSKRDRVATVLLETGSLMMCSGANTERIRVTLRRMASYWGYNLEVMITHRSLIITVMDQTGEAAFSKIKRIEPHTVNFSIVSDISHMSWKVVAENWTIEDVVNELERIRKTPRHKRLLVLLTVGLSDASFCFLIDGGFVAMGISFIATVIGLFVKQEISKRKINSFVVVAIASFVAAFIGQFAYIIPYCKTPDAAFATSVLYLIPGIPLVNSITDLIDGDTQNGIARGVNAFLISFAIALGLMVAKMFSPLFI